MSSLPVRRRRVRPAGLRLPLLAHIGLFLALAVVVSTAAGVLIWASLGHPNLIGRPATALGVGDRFDVVKLILTVVGGIGAVVALTIAYRRQRHGEAAEYREDTKLYTDRFGRAAEQLGHDKAAVRLAGAYALAELADDWDDGRQVCIDVLCAYLRMPYTPPTDPDPAANLPTDEYRQAQQTALLARQERQVRHTVITLIRDHLRPDAPTPWQGHTFDFTGALFDGGDLSRIHLTTGTMNFTNATFPGGTVNFGPATFSGGTVNFGSATFSGGTVNFGLATFSGGIVDFGLATFSGGIVDFGPATFSGGIVDFDSATFSGGIVDFDSATFSGGIVNFRSAKFSGAIVHFLGAAFSGGTATFRAATFSGGTVDLSQPRVFSTPPRFDSWPSGPPAGLLLPSSGP